MKNRPPPLETMYHFRQFVRFYEDGAAYARKFLSEPVRQPPLPGNSVDFTAFLGEYFRRFPSRNQYVKICILSPHPDDEILTGALALRLKNEKGAAVTNIALTLGSLPERKAARKAELEAACDILGFQLRMAQEPLCFDSVKAEMQRGAAPEWHAMINHLVRHFHEIQPDMIFYPHARDAHQTHIGSHYLAVQAIECYERATGRRVLHCETGFWSPVCDSNLLVGLSGDDLALLLYALSKHKGELERNPYQVRLPARMMLNVERGGEMIFGRTAKCPDMLFGEAYRLIWGKSDMPSMDIKLKLLYGLPDFSEAHGAKPQH